MAIRSRRRALDRATALLLLSLVPTICTGASKGAGGEYVPSSPDNLLRIDKYYEDVNPVEAAAALRRDAGRFHLDIREHPATSRSMRPFSVLQLHMARIAPDFSDRSYLSSLEDATGIVDPQRKRVAIIAVRRELSIDEVAVILESDVRILERLFADKAQVFGGYIVRGRPADLVAISRREYFAWMGEYSPELKRYADLGASPLGRYSVFLFGHAIEERFLDDLRTLGAQVLHSSGTFAAIDVACPWETALEICALDWVRSLFPNEPGVDWEAGGSAGN